MECYTLSHFKRSLTTIKIEIHDKRKQTNPTRKDQRTGVKREGDREREREKELAYCEPHKLNFRMFWALVTSVTNEGQKENVNIRFGQVIRASFCHFLWP